MRRVAAKRVATVAVAALALLGAGCLGGCGGGEPASDSEPTGFAAVLAGVGGGGENGSLGVGWVDERAAAELDPRTRAELERALGPNADTVVEQAPALRRRFGLDPHAATALVSLGGSYAFGLRLDGVGAPGLRRALIAAGARARDAEGTELLRIGNYAEVPEPLLRAGINGLGARDAFARDNTVLAISEAARAALLGRGDVLLEQPIYAQAASCLGDVIAARLVPAKLVLSTELATDLVAVGIERSTGPGPPHREVLCLLGGAAADANRLAAALSDSLDPAARDPRSGARIGADVSRVSVERPAGEVEQVRAQLTLAPGARPGFVFDVLAAGSLPAYLTPGG